VEGRATAPTARTTRAAVWAWLKTSFSFPFCRGWYRKCCDVHSTLFVRFRLGFFGRADYAGSSLFWFSPAAWSSPSAALAGSSSGSVGSTAKRPRLAQSGLGQALGAGRVWLRPSSAWSASWRQCAAASALDLRARRSERMSGSWSPGLAMRLRPCWVATRTSASSGQYWTTSPFRPGLGTSR